MEELCPWAFYTDEMRDIIVVYTPNQKRDLTWTEHTKQVDILLSDINNQIELLHA